MLAGSGSCISAWLLVSAASKAHVHVEKDAMHDRFEIALHTAYAWLDLFSFTKFVLCKSLGSSNELAPSPSKIYCCPDWQYAYVSYHVHTYHTIRIQH